MQSNKENIYVHKNEALEIRRTNNIGKYRMLAHIIGQMLNKILFDTDILKKF